MLGWRVRRGQRRRNGGRGMGGCCFQDIRTTIHGLAGAFMYFLARACTQVFRGRPIQAPAGPLDAPLPFAYRGLWWEHDVGFAELRASTLSRRIKPSKFPLVPLVQEAWIRCFPAGSSIAAGRKNKDAIQRGRVDWLGRRGSAGGTPSACIGRRGTRGGREVAGPPTGCARTNGERNAIRAKCSSFQLITHSPSRQWTER